jgi:hypothetical protein
MGLENDFYEELKSVDLNESPNRWVIYEYDSQKGDRITEVDSVSGLVVRCSRFANKKYE